MHSSIFVLDGALSCGFEQGLIGDCSDIKIHDTYQKSYEDISWTEAAWEVRIS